MFDKVLIANRGEISCRIILTCQRLGIRTVAIFSPVDRDSPHVSMADEAICIVGGNSRSAYLDVDSVIAAATRTGANAVHPGYGFLSESAEFARRLEQAGLIFIGPRPDTIAAMGLKAAAKATMAQAGVPTIPGYHGADQNDQSLLREAKRIGYPLMIKASAGGGGKGMRVVHNVDEFLSALAGARREAEAAFGDGTVLLERYINHPHHVEIQIFGDNSGEVVHLFERECSLQRRFQKVVEESPSPFITPRTLGRMAEAAVKAARTVGYVNAGTVEFIVDQEQNFYFMEMNTRLQVEHAVTEATTGLDLVEWQLRIAAGEPLPLNQEKIRRCGHAIETRIYAENPSREFVPSPGQIRAIDWPEGEEIRIDTGVTIGSQISSDFDPMIAKLTIHAADRKTAVSKLRTALANTNLLGPTTNLGLLRGISKHPDFYAGVYDTSFIVKELPILLQRQEVRPEHVAVIAAAFLNAAHGASNTPWRSDGFQIVARPEWRIGLKPVNGEPAYWGVINHLDHWLVRPDSSNATASTFMLTPLSDTAWSVEANGHAHRICIRRHESFFFLVERDNVIAIEWLPFSQKDDQAPSAKELPTSPMPGQVIAVHVSSGMKIRENTPLVTLEGMKMEYIVRSRYDAVVGTIHCSPGQRVDIEELLMDLEPAEETP